MSYINAERIGCILLLALSSIFFQKSLVLPYKGYDPLGAAFFPKLITVILVIIALFILFFDIKKKGLKLKPINERKNKDKIEAEKVDHSILPVIFLGSSFVLYSLVLNYLGYIFSTIAFLLVTIFGLNLTKKGLGQAVIFSIGTTVVIYYIFRLVLNLIFPSGIF